MQFTNLCISVLKAHALSQNPHRTSYEQLNAPRSCYLLFKGIAFLLQVSCIAIQNVGVLRLDVDVLEEVVPHVGMVTFRVVSGQT